MKDESKKHFYEIILVQEPGEYLQNFHLSLQDSSRHFVYGTRVSPYEKKTCKDGIEMKNRLAKFKTTFKIGSSTSESRRDKKLIMSHFKDNENPKTSKQEKRRL